MRALPAVGLVLGLIALPFAEARADRLDPFATSAPGPWQSGAKARALLAPWAGCEMQREATAPAEDGEAVRVRKVGRDVEVERYSAGSGRWATALTKAWRLDGGTCTGAGFAAMGGKESLWSWMSLVAAGRTATHPLAAEMNDAILVTEQRGPELAAARLLLELIRDTPAPSKPGELFDPEDLAPQAEHAGAPRGGPATLWSPQAMQLGNLSTDGAPEELKPDGGRIDGVLIGAIRAPKVLVTKGRWQLWELRFRARLGGGLLAVYDRKRKQHRWVLATERDGGKAGRFEVLAIRGELALLRTHLDDSEALWAIELTSGRTRRLARNGPFHLRSSGAGEELEVTGEDGGRQRLPLASLRP